MMEPNTDYTNPDHLLTGVPQAVLDEARVVLRAAAHFGDVAGEAAEPLADSVLMAVVPFVAGWQPKKVATET